MLRTVADQPTLWEAILPDPRARHVVGSRFGLVTTTAIKGLCACQRHWC